MKHEHVIYMARQAGFCVNEDGSSISTNNSYGVLGDELDRFAELVAANERNKLLSMLGSLCHEAMVMKEHDAT